MCMELHFILEQAYDIILFLHFLLLMSFRVRWILTYAKKVIMRNST